MTAFSVEIPVRFQHCDPAGIVFYPRYFEMINQLVEDWFAGALDHDFQSLHEGHGCGVPTVRMECDFKRPSRLGEVLTFSLAVAALGRSSFTLDLAAACRGEERLRAKAVLTYVTLDTLSPAPIPDALRAAMMGFLYGGEQEAAS